MKKISKFVRTNILPGAIAEVGLLCCAFVHSNPEEAVAQILEPMLLAVISSLKEIPVTGYGGKGSAHILVSNKVFLLVNSFGSKFMRSLQFEKADDLFHFFLSPFSSKTNTHFLQRLRQLLIIS